MRLYGASTGAFCVLHVVLIMASEEVKKRIKENFEWCEKYSTRFDLDVIDANVQLAEYTLKQERDVDTCLDICKRTKPLMDNWVARMTDGRTFWESEHVAQLEGKNYPFVDLAYRIYKMESPYLFESYLFYMEKNRKYEKRFYIPRRCTLKTVVEDMQRLEDDELDIYGLSMPSRVGKTGMGVFFLTWVGYKKPWSHSAAGGHSGQVAKRIFTGYKNIVDTEDYCFNELFMDLHPEYKKPIEKISSDPAEFTINLGDPDEFATMTCRGADASWTGVIDISNDGYLYVDDLIRDREHSMSATRMENTYQQYQNTMLDRMNNTSKRLLVGTLWSVLDPLERERKMNENNPRALFRKIPALDENDKSNFRYEYNGFSSHYYIQMRERLDRAEYMAKFQQEPFVREGLLLPIEQLRFFNGIVPTEGNRKIVAALDPAFGKGDFLSMPICMDYGDTEKYIIDWIYDNRTQGFTVPEIVDKIKEHFIMELTIEKNNGGDLMADNIQKEMDERGIHHCKIIRKSAPVKMSKEDKISAFAPFVLRHFQFLEPKKWTETEPDEVFTYHPSDQYRKAIDDMVMYSPEGKNKHDDSPDSIAQLAMVFDIRKRNRESRIIHSPI